MDRAENVCPDPVILFKEVKRLSKVLHYNNYPQWLIDKQGQSDKSGTLIHPDTGQDRTWSEETILHLGPLFPRSEWVLQKDIQIHHYTGLF